MASALRHVFLVLVLTAALFFTHLLQHVDDNTETYAPKEWIGVLRKSTLATRAAGLQQWVTNRTHGLVARTQLQSFDSWADVDQVRVFSVLVVDHECAAIDQKSVLECGINGHDKL